MGPLKHLRAGAAANRKWALVLGVMTLAGPASASPPCDPFSVDQPQPIPMALRLANTCGNGKIDTYATACTLRIAGGCGQKETRASSCEQQTETCDGNAVGGQTCRGLGFAGGKLRCTRGCLELDTSGCTLCEAGAVCTELSRRTANYRDLIVVARGEVVRAFWVVADQDLMTATIDAHARLGVPTRVGTYQSSIIATATGLGPSWMEVIGEPTRPALAVIHGDGEISTTPLSGSYPSIAWPILPLPEGDTAAVLVGALNNYPALAVTDAAGKVTPATAPLYAANLFYRVALVPLTAGRHVIRQQHGQAAFVFEEGDALALLLKPEVGVPSTLLINLWRGGTMTGLAWTPTTEVVTPSTVDLDGRRLATFSATQDVIDGKIYPVAPMVMPEPGAHPLLPIAYQATGFTIAPRLSVAQTPAFDVHAYLLELPAGPDDVVRSRAAIGVVPHARAPADPAPRRGGD